MKYLIKYVISAVIVLISITSYAEVVVIVHPSNDSSLDPNLIKRIYLGKVKSFSNDNIIVPINQVSSVAVTGDFSKKVLKNHPANSRPIGQN